LIHFNVTLLWMRYRSLLRCL